MAVAKVSSAHPFGDSQLLEQEIYLFIEETIHPGSDKIIHDYICFPISVFANAIICLKSPER